MSARRLLLVLLAVVVAACAQAGAADASTGPYAPAASRTLSRCVQDTGRLSVLVLVDQSESLAPPKGTDPQNDRVDGLKAALTGLARLSEERLGKHRASVDVMLAGFGTKLDTGPSGGQWQSVTSGSLNGLLARADQFKSRNTDVDTDYGTALMGARQILAQRAADQTKKGGSPPCRALIWFTDGEYSIESRIGQFAGVPTGVKYAKGVNLAEEGGGEQAVRVGKHLLCQGGGVMDGLEEDGVVLFTVALSKKISAANRDFLESVTDGRGGGKHCGRKLSPASGKYFPVPDAAGLFFAFSDLFAGPVRGPFRLPGVCQRKPCQKGIARFQVVRGIRGFLIDASTGADRIDIELAGPTGRAVRLRPGDPDRRRVAGVPITQRWVSSRTVEIDGALSQAVAGAVGGWRMWFIDPTGPNARAQPIYAVRLFADAQPDLVQQPKLTRPGRTPLTFHLVNGAGAQVPSLPIFRMASLTARVTDPTTGRTRQLKLRGPSATGQWTGTVAIPGTSTASRMFVEADARFPGSKAVPIQPETRSFTLDTQLPPGLGFPTVTPTQLALPSVHGSDATHETLTVTGSKAGGGCVWIGPNPKLNDLGRVDNVRLTTSPAAASPSQCVRLRAGETKHIRVTLRSDVSGHDVEPGRAEATLAVHLSSDVVHKAQTIAIPAAFQTLAPPDVTGQCAAEPRCPDAPPEPRSGEVHGASARQRARSRRDPQGGRHDRRHAYATSGRHPLPRVRGAVERRRGAPRPRYPSRRHGAAHGRQRQPHGPLVPPAPGPVRRGDDERRAGGGGRRPAAAQAAARGARARGPDLAAGNMAVLPDVERTAARRRERRRCSAAPPDRRQAGAADRPQRRRQGGPGAAQPGRARAS
jgi:hypothetical protein